MQQLRGLILRGEYAVGDKLPPERKLAEELGVNRASLREAIKSLEHMGLVKTRQGDGMPNLDVLTDVLEFRRWFGRESARQAAERATPDDVKKLEGMADQAADPQLDLNELLKIDFEFYVAMTTVGRNRVMQLLINTIRSAVMSYAPFFAQFNPPATAVRKHHRDLIKAIATKDGEGASKIADAYLKKGTEQFLATIRPPQSA